MAKKDPGTPEIPSVRAALEVLTVDKLKPLLALLPDASPATRKADLVDTIERYTHGAKLAALWGKLDETQKLAVAETLYSNTGLFEPARFKAKHGALPIFGYRKEGSYSAYNQTPSFLRLFLYSGGRYNNETESSIPTDLQQRLRAFVPKPKATALPVVGELPEHYERTNQEYEWQTDSESMKLYQIPLTRRDTERDALAEAALVLRLVEQGKLAVSEKTALPGAATLKELGNALTNGDFYQPSAKAPQGWEEIGPIKAYAWPLLLQAAKLAESQGRKLALTKAGRDLLGKPAAEALRALWQRWLKNTLFDEFNRVEAIKGQKGKGERGMTAASGRRSVAGQALRQCPVGAWVEFERFSRYMQASGQNFEVTRDPWNLYISDSNYGSLGHHGYHDWPILQKRYLLALLFEYAATLGMIDLAYVPPWEAQRDYSSLWGTDDLDFLSRYDGLAYFRLNPLGAYCLGLADTYQPSAPASRVRLSVLPSLLVNVAEGAPSPEEALFLDDWAERDAESTWRLSRPKMIEAVERGRSLDELRGFLEARDPQGLPEPVDGFISSTARQAGALAHRGSALLLECADADLASLIAGHELTKGLCLKAGAKHLAVKAEAEEKFRAALRALGYGLPR